MGMAPLRPCAGGCGRRVQAGRCPACESRHKEAQGRGTPRSGRAGGYDRHWEAFRRQLAAALVEQGIPLVCGAALPDGPKTTHSRCKAEGVWTFDSSNGTSLHYDHEPELRDEERGDPAAVCDARRIQLLCGSCHAAKQRVHRRSA